MGRSPIARARRRANDESGFTLVEAVVALFVLGIIFTALAAASMGSLRASLASRSEQQGIDFATQALERARAFEYSDLANRPADMTGDPAVVVGSADCSSIGSGSTKCVDVSGSGDYEPLVLSDTGAIYPHVDASIPKENANNVDFKTFTYVTDPGDPTASQVRVTVVSRWVVAGVARNRSTSSLVTQTAGSGLPLPKFELAPISSMREIVGPGAQANYLFRVTNQGAPDRWNLRATGFQPGIWSFYRETGTTGLCLDALDCPGDVVDTALTDSNADGVVDTGKVDPTDSMQFWLVGTVPPDSVPSLGIFYNVIVTAASILQPPGAVPSGTTDACTAFTAIAGIACQPAEVDVVAAPSASPSATPTVSTTPTPSATPSSSSTVSTPPGTPSNVTPTIGNGSVSLVWSQPSAGTGTITGYTVKYKLASSTVWTDLSPSPTGPSVTIGSLTNNQPYDFQVFAVNSANLTGPGSSIVTATPSSYIQPVTCAAAVPPAGGTDPTFLVKSYVLHNTSPWNTFWPSNGLDSRTDTQQLPLSMEVNGTALWPQNTNLPVYSADISATEGGRILQKTTNGFAESYTATTKVVDWRSDVTGKRYKGTAVLRLWVAPPLGTDMTGKGITLNAQLFKSSATNRQPSATDLKWNKPSVAVASSPATTAWSCSGWQQVTFSFAGIDTTKSPLTTSQYIGVRVWNPGGTGMLDNVRLAYDVTGDFMATLAIPEK